MKAPASRPRIAFSPVRQLALGLLLLASLFPGAALAGKELDNWRREAAEARQLAENDAPQANREANRLQAAMPADAKPADQALILNLRARTELYLTQAETAAADAEKALAIARANGDKIGQAEANLNIVLLTLRQGRIAAMGEAAAAALAHLEGARRPDLLGEAMLHTAMVYLRNGQLESSITLSMQAMDMAQRSGDPLFLTYAFQSMAISMEQSGRTEKALEHYNRMRDQARIAGSRILEAHAAKGMAMIANAQGQHRVAESGVREALALFRATGTPLNVGHALFSLAEVQQAQNRREEALATLNEVMNIYERNPNKIGLWWTLNTRSADHLSLGHIAAATADAERAYALAKEIDAALYLAGSTRQLAALAAARGDHQRAYALSMDAADITAQGKKKQAGEQIDKLAERYQSEAKQRQIEELTRQAQRQALEQRWLWTILAATLLLLAVSGAFLLNLRRINHLLAELNARVQRSSRKLKATLDALPDLLFEIGLDGRIHDYHSPRLDLLAAPPEHLIGRTMAELLPPEVEQICMAALCEANDKGTSTGKQYSLLLPRGTTCFELSVARKPDAADREPHFIVLSRDITERKAMEEALRASERKYRTLAENLPDYVARYDGEGRKTYFNTAVAKLLGPDAESHLGKTVEEGIAENKLRICKTYWNELRRVIASGESGEIEIKVNAPGGEQQTHSIRFVAERDEAGNIAGVLAVGRDITRIVETERQLEELSRQLRELAARRESAREEERRHIAREIHDDLGQQLTALRLKVNLLNLQFGGFTPPLRESTASLLGMVDQTIQVARNVSTSLRPSTLDMGIVPALEWLAGEFQRNSGIRCEMRASLPDLALGEEQSIILFRIAQESLTNVARHAAASQVRITLDAADGELVLEIADDGVGFDPKAHRVQKFGLVGIRERVLAVGGATEIASEPGNGTRVRVNIPRRRKGDTP